MTGGAGFIGSHVAEFFAEKEDIEKVFIIDNLSRAKLLHKEIKDLNYNWNLLMKSPKVEGFKEDMRDYKFLKQFFSSHEVDIIIHTAGQTAVTTSLIDPKNDFENNLLGSYNLLESVRSSNQSDPTMIYCSTNKVFGNNVNDCEVEEGETRYSFSGKYKNGISEKFPIDLCEHTPYGASKLCSDLYFQEYGHLYGFRTGVFRMSCIYGTRQFGVEDQGWIAHFVNSAIKNKKLTIFGDGKQVRDILYISDLIAAFNSFINKAKKLGHQVFCMGGGNSNSISLLELIQFLESELKAKLDYEFQDWRPSDQKVYISDISKAKNFLDWEPKVSSFEGIGKLIKWFQEH